MILLPVAVPMTKPRPCRVLAFTAVIWVTSCAALSSMLTVPVILRSVSTTCSVVSRGAKLTALPQSSVRPELLYDVPPESAPVA